MVPFFFEPKETKSLKYNKRFLLCTKKGGLFEVILLSFQIEKTSGSGASLIC